MDAIDQTFVEKAAEKRRPPFHDQGVQREALPEQLHENARVNATFSRRHRNHRASALGQGVAASQQRALGHGHYHGRLACRANQLGFQGKARGGIDHDARRLGDLASIEAARQQRIVGERRADAHHDPGMAVAVLMNAAARRLSGHPARKPLPRGHLPVQGHGVFGYHQGTALLHGVQERFVDSAARWLQDPHGHFDAGPPQSLVARHKRVGIEHAHDHARNAGLDKRLGARRRLARMAAGLQGDIGRGTGRRLAASRKRLPLGMGTAETVVPALADDTAVSHNDGADKGVGARPSRSAPGQLNGSGHEALISLSGQRAVGIR